MADITVEGLSKSFRVRRPVAKGQAKAGALARLLAPRPVVELPAVSNISFAVAAALVWPGDRLWRRSFDKPAALP